MIRILIVDDSAFMRTALTKLFGSEGDFEVRTARDGEEALSQVREFDPHVLTMDVNMPGMDGLTCLAHVMTESPRPVVMLSSLTTAGAVATMEALAMGAVDFIPKPGGTISLELRSIAPELVARVRAAAGVKRLRHGARAAAVPRRQPPSPEWRPDNVGDVEGIVVIGSSTGGPSALEEVLRPLPADFPLPVVIAQHMPSGFTRALAQRLSGLLQLAVVEVDRSTPLAPGVVAIGRGDADIVVARRGSGLRAISVPSDPRFLWHPSVDRLVQSVGSCVSPQKTIGVLLTGMGNDGAASLARLRAQGAHTVAESASSCVVNGMPAALIAAGGADVVLDAADIGKHVNRLARKGRHDETLASAR